MTATAFTSTNPEIMAAMNGLLKACQLQGESGTEQLYYWLFDALHNLDGTIEDSHEEGLCYDMCAAIADELTGRVLGQSTLGAIAKGC